MKLILLPAALLSLVFAVAALAGNPVNGTDRANAARACTTLRTSLGASTFSHNYATFGACTSQWVRTAHTARLAATKACAAKGLHGTELSSCIKTQTSTTISTDVSLTKNASKACAADLHSLGLAAFEQKYVLAGTNHNLRNAFGKCVSSRVKAAAAAAKNGASTNSGSSTPGTQHFTVSLSPLNNSGVSGSGTLFRNHDALTVKLDITGLEAGQTHTLSIRGLASGNATCPSGAADANTDGLMSLAEGQVFFGDELLALSPSTLGHAQTVSSTVLPLQTRAIVAFGMTVKGSFDATVPVACGLITLA